MLCDNLERRGNHPHGLDLRYGAEGAGGGPSEHAAGASDKAEGVMYEALEVEGKVKTNNMRQKSIYYTQGSLIVSFIYMFQHQIHLHLINLLLLFFLLLLLLRVSVSHFVRIIQDLITNKHVLDVVDRLPILVRRFWRKLNVSKPEEFASVGLL